MPCSDPLCYIPVICVVILVLVILVIACIYKCCCSPKKERKYWNDWQQPPQKQRKRKGSFEEDDKFDQEASFARSAGLRVEELDLHGYSVPGAIQQLKTTLLKMKNKTKLVVITGRGKHSSGRVPKIKPAVKNYLCQKGYRYGEDISNPGRINVFISFSNINDIV